MNTSIASRIIRKRYEDQSLSEQLNRFQNHLSLAFDSEEMQLNIEGIEENLSLVVDYLRKTHAYYRNACFPEIEQQLLEIIKNGGIHGLIALKALEDFRAYANHMIQHMKEEEKYFFPYAESLFIGIRNDKVNAIDFKHEQKEERSVLTEMRIMIASMIKRDTDFSVFSIVCQKLNWLERDIKLHAKIEEQVLIPIMIKLENERGC